MHTVEQRILNVAKSLFTQRGFANVSVRDICREANVTAPTIYYYFRNKEALFDAVVREAITMAEFIARLRTSYSKAERADSRIRDFVRTYLLFFPSELMNVGLYLRRSTELDRVGAKTLVAELDRIELLLVEIIRDGITRGEFRRTDPRLAAECLLGMMNRFIFQNIHFGRRYRPPETAQRVSEFFLRAMRSGVK